MLIKETGLKQALQLYILQTKNRFSKQSILLRKLLKLLCQYSTEENTNLLEALWKECISEYILEKYIQIPNTTTASNNNNLIKNEKRKNSDKNSEIYMDNLINTLIKELNNIRYISKIDMSIIKNCNITTDLAFVIAFKRLSKEQSIELTKALVVRISTLIDTYKTQSMTRFWADEVEKITDFIQVGGRKESFLHSFCDFILYVLLHYNGFNSIYTYILLGFYYILTMNNLVYNIIYYVGLIVILYVIILGLIAIVYNEHGLIIYIYI